MLAFSGLSKLLVVTCNLGMTLLASLTGCLATQATERQVELMINPK
jgi:hypothetical protein